MFSALNLELADWYGLFKKKELVDALLDRLQHHCITIRIDGPSLRSPEPPPPVQPAPDVPSGKGTAAGKRPKASSHPAPKRVRPAEQEP